MRHTPLILALALAWPCSSPSARAEPSSSGTLTSSASAGSVAAPSYRVESEAPAAGRGEASGPSASSDRPESQFDPKSAATGAPDRKAAPVAAGLVRGDLVPLTSDRSYYLRGLSQFRMLAISDPDPANGRVLLWSVEGGYRLAPTASLFIRGGLLQRFVVPSTSTELIPAGLPLPSASELASIDTSPVLLRDTVVGARYRHTFDLGAALGGRTLDVRNTFNIYLPTSLSSQRRELVFAPELVSRSRLSVTKSLAVGADLSAQYRFHRSAERAGRGAGENVQAQFTSALAADYNIATFGDWGSLDTGADIRTAWEKTYPSQDTHASSTSSRNFWRQDYGFDCYLSYTPKGWLSLSVSLEQGAPVLRDGIVNVRIPNRDETELVFTVAGTF